MASDVSSKVLVLLVTYLVVKVHAFPDDEGCIGIRECPAALKHVKNAKNNNESLKILRRAHCGFNGKVPIVKCSTIPDLPDSDSGTGCIRLQDCPKAVRIIHQGVFDPVVVNLFRSVHCGAQKMHPMIYCHKLSPVPSMRV
ncbi:uncharacterized protein LOC135129077 [Zophobas morio]|uniref:uncharacterized protein LOC135129077 n=1 Tax=Zophobas morio TaxID=2755281 RepID=UPI003082B296